MSKEIQEWESLNKLEKLIESVLDIKESWYDSCLVDTSKGKKVNDDFTMPLGIGVAQEGRKYFIAIDGELWDKYLEETDQKKKMRRYARFARVLAHELMHLYQFKHLFNRHLKEFYYERDLPDNHEWNDRQYKKYANLNIEIEAFAFGALVESTILNRKRISYIPSDMNKYQFKKVYSRIKSTYEKKIRKRLQIIVNNCKLLAYDTIYSGNKT